MSRKRLTILGSTGSIGTQTLEIVAAQPDSYQVETLTAGSNWQLLAKQAKEFNPERVVIAEDEYYAPLKAALESLDIEVASGNQAVKEAGANDTDLVISAIVGFAGLQPTLAAIKAGNNVGLANKESLVVGGHLIHEALEGSLAELLPIDSEHSAMFQCLEGNSISDVKRLILTASGGPFRGFSYEQLKQVRVEDALAHPNWEMGSKVTIDSATLMNKGLEMIEACWLFNVKPEQVDVIVHPQSIIHSMVEYQDGNVLAQLGAHDMRIPIQYAMTYPLRSAWNPQALDFNKYYNLTFEQPDIDNFACLNLCYAAMQEGGSMPAVLNAANEVAVAFFLKGKLPFLDIPVVIERVMNKFTKCNNPQLEELIQLDRNVRIFTESLIGGLN